MDVAALLNRQLLQQLTIVLGSRHTLHPAGGWSELRTLLQQRAIDVLVADPIADGLNRADALVEIHHELPSLPIVIYTTLTGASMHAIVQLGRAGVEHVVLSRFDDDRRRFLELLERAPGQALSERMLWALAPQLERLPGSVVRAIELLFRSPGRFSTAQDLAAASGAILRTFYRQLDAAGLHSPRLLVASAKLLRVYSLLQDPDRRIKEAAASAGYHSPHQLIQHMRALAGDTPRAVRRTLQPEEFVARLKAGVTRPRQIQARQERDSS